MRQNIRKAWRSMQQFFLMVSGHPVNRANLYARILERNLKTQGMICSLKSFADILKKNLQQPLFIQLCLLNLGFFFLLTPSLADAALSLDVLLRCIGSFFVLNYILSLVGFSMPQRGKRILLLFSAILAFIDALSLFLAGQPFSLPFLPILLETNPQEAAEFLEAHAYGSPMGRLCLILTLLSFLPQARRAFCWLWQVFCHMFPSVVSSLAALFAVCFFLSTGMAADRFLPAGNNIIRLASELPAVPNWLRMPGKAIPQVSSYNEIPYVVVVLGESSSRLHYSLYGYPIPTTPGLEAEQAAENLLAFREAEAPAHYTLASLGYLFSTQTRQQSGPWGSFPTVFDILSQTRYQTAWLSNQENFGLLGSREMTLAHQNERHAFTMDASLSSYTRRYDGALLPLLDRAIEERDPMRPQFYTIHLMGSHSVYDKRYPEPFQPFLPEQEEGDTEEARKTRASYDTSIRYTDEVLQGIFDRFRREDAIILYLSDHGEDVYDEEKSALAGHRPQGSREELQIPFVIWGSDTFIRKHEDIWSRLKDQTDTPFCTEILPDILWEILDLRFAAPDDAHNGHAEE